MECKFKDNGYNESDKVPNADRDKDLKFSCTTDRVQFGTTALEDFFSLSVLSNFPTKSKYASLSHQKQ